MLFKNLWQQVVSLKNQFLSPADNKRTDFYGDNLENIMRILVEIYQGIRQVTKSNFIVGIKLNSSDFSSEGFSEDDSYRVIVKMSNLGIDFIEISGGNYERTKFLENSNGEAFFLKFSKKSQVSVNIPIMLTGGLSSQEAMENVVTNEGIAMVGSVRPFVLNPNSPEKMLSGIFEGLKLPHLTTGVKVIDNKLGHGGSSILWATDETIILK